MARYSHDRVENCKSEKQDCFDKDQSRVDRERPTSVVFTLEHLMMQNAVLGTFPFPDAKDNQNEDTNNHGR